MLAAKLLHDPVHIASCLTSTHVVLQPRNALDEVRSAAIGIAREREWPPDVHIFSVGQRVVHISRMHGARRHYPDDGERLHVERDLLPDDVRIGAEPRAPKPVTDDDLQAIAGDLGGAVEFAAELRMKPEHMEIA